MDIFGCVQMIINDFPRSENNNWWYIKDGKVEEDFVGRTDCTLNGSPLYSQ